MGVSLVRLLVLAEISSGAYSGASWMNITDKNKQTVLFFSLSG